MNQPLSQPVENKDQTPATELPTFFLVVTPGFETLAEKEINRWLPIGTPVAVERGGLTVCLPLEDGFKLNRVLKIPTRILLRLNDFGCRDFPKLFKKTAGFDWGKWIPSGARVDFQASSHSSRLAIKKRIEETCADGYKKYLKKPAASLDAAAPQSPSATKDLKASAVSFEFQVLVRFENDVCTMSLDTSGELLHKRGTKTLSAEAPLRETIAAALLTWMTTEASGDVTLIDPMIGSGTFAIEAAQLDQPITARRYAFEFLNRTSSSSSTDSTLSQMNPPKPNPVHFAKFIGFDIDQRATESALGNWKSLGDQRGLSVRTEDIFDAKPLVIEGKRWLITNPPYGERLKIEGRLKDYYELLFEACERVSKPERACFLLPDTARPERLRAPRRWHLAQSLKFQNGGLPVTALLFINDI